MKGRYYTNKVPRFVKEYANYKKKQIKENDFVLPDTRNELASHVEKTVKVLERGLITVDEAIDCIHSIY